MRSTVLKDYKIDSLRMEELQRVCWQYKRMRKEAAESITLPTQSYNDNGSRARGTHSDPTAGAAQRREGLLTRIKAIEKCAQLAGKDQANGLLLGVINRGSSYEYLQVNRKIFCGRRQYYEMRAKFFWLLDKELL